jgi:hypothetical protein
LVEAHAAKNVDGSIDQSVKWSVALCSTRGNNKAAGNEFVHGVLAWGIEWAKLCQGTARIGHHNAFASRRPTQ